MSPNPFSNNKPVFVVGALCALFILAYAFFVALPYLMGPSLFVSSPKEGSTLTDPLVIIEGSTRRVSYLSINGMDMPMEPDGSFSIVRALPPGYTVVVVRAKDRFNREVVKTVPFVHAFTTHTPNADIGTTTNATTEKKR